jgi:hypothetical protein
MKEENKLMTKRPKILSTLFKLPFYCPGVTVAAAPSFSAAALLMAITSLLLFKTWLTPNPRSKISGRERIEALTKALPSVGVSI